MLLIYKMVSLDRTGHDKTKIYRTGQKTKAGKNKRREIGIARKFYLWFYQPASRKEANKTKKEGQFGGVDPSVNIHK